MTGQCQLDLGDGTTAMGATTTAQREGCRLGFFGLAQSAWLDWLWHGFCLALARFGLLGSAGLRSARLGLFGLAWFCSVRLGSLGSAQLTGLSWLGLV